MESPTPRELRHAADYVELNPLVNRWGDGGGIPYCLASFLVVDRMQRARGHIHWLSSNPRCKAKDLPFAPTHIDLTAGGEKILKWFCLHFPTYFNEYGENSIFTIPERPEDDRQESRTAFAKLLRETATNMEQGEFKPEPSHDIAINPAYDENAVLVMA